MLIISATLGAVKGNITEVNSAALNSCVEAVELCIYLAGGMCMWGGVMRVAEKAGITDALANIFKPFLKHLFKGLDTSGKAFHAICMNITANLLGLGNASTPFGISAMKEIEAEEKSKTPKKASHNMILLTVMNTASLQIIPATVAAIRLRNGSEDPMEILPCVWIVSALSLTAALLGASFFKKLSGKRL